MALDMVLDMALDMAHADIPVHDVGVGAILGALWPAHADADAELGTNKADSELRVAVNMAQAAARHGEV